MIFYQLIVFIEKEQSITFDAYISEMDGVPFFEKDTGGS